MALIVLSLVSLAHAASPSPEPAEALGSSPWPILTGSLALFLLFFTWWQQARHRRRIEKANTELRLSQDELRRAFNALQDSETKFRLLFERSADSILLLDPTRGPKFIDCNEATVRMLGYRTKEEIIGLIPGQLSSPNQPDGDPSVPKAEEMVKLAIRNGSHRFEWYTRRADNTFITTEVVMTPVQFSEKPLIVTVARDITERKKAELALHSHQKLLTSIVENISEGIYRSSPEQGLIFANTSYLKMFGYDSLEDLRSVPRENLYANPADRANLIQQLEATGSFANEEIRYRRKNGTTFWGLASSIAIFYPGTQLIDYHVGAITDITDRKNAEDEIRKLNDDLERRIAERTGELRSSEAILRTMIEHAPEAIVVFDAKTSRFTAVNENATRLYGISREALLNLTPTDVSPPFQADGRPTPEVAAEKIQQALAGEPPVFEWIHCHSDGRRIPSEIRLVRLPVEGQDLIRASIIDTSERRRREKIQQATYQISEAVHTAEDLENLYERIHSIIRTFMPADNFYLSLHNPATGLYHYDYHVDLVDPKPQPRQMQSGLNGYVIRSGKALLATRESMTDPANEWRLAAGTPSSVWLGVPLLLKGRILGVMVVQDYDDPNAYGEDEKQILTFVAEQIALAIERKRAEQALRESEEKHRALFEATVQGVILQDEEKFIDVNPAALRLLGYTRREELLGQTPAATSAPRQMNGQPAEDLARKYVHDCMAHGTARFEWLARHADGKEIPMEVILTRIQMCDRPLIQAVLNDITERKNAEAELLKSLAREKELSALKSNFVSMVSHEFRTPLGVILSSTEILTDYFEQLEPPERNEHLQSIRKNTRRMGELMEEVLLLSRVEAGKLNFEPSPVDLPHFCRRLVDEVLSATSRRCPIDLQLDWPGDQALADERLLRHIFTNLLSNAVKYSPPCAPIHFTLTRREGQAIFEVRDSGIGIPEQDQQWLFNAFQRARNVGNIPGTGLGLVIVKRCVELHGGAIHLESALGQGTHIIVHLPVPTTRLSEPASPLTNTQA